jgi:hypothetical protein
MTLISFSMPTNLTPPLPNQGGVLVLGIYHGSHEVSMSTLLALFCKISCLTAALGALAALTKIGNHSMNILAY